MIFLPYALLIVFAFTFVLDAKKAILIAVIIRPVIDCFYETQYAFLGLKPTEYLGVLLPVFVFWSILFSKGRSFIRSPLSLIWIIYIFFQLFSAILIMTVGEDFQLAINYYFRSFNGFIGFFIFQNFFNKKNDFRMLLVAHLIAGLAPLGMSFYQNILGGMIRSESTIGDLVRNIGFYHDAYTLRLYCFQTLAAVILYWCYFVRDVSVLRRSALLMLSFIASLTIYKLFSKAGYVISAEWLLVWNVLQKKYLLLCAMLVLVIAASFFMRGHVSGTIDTVYSKEIGALQGKEKFDRLFQGRVGVWRVLFKEYSNWPIVVKLVGDGLPHTGDHNDFIRVLLSTGIIGLLLYLVLLGCIGLKTIVNCLKDNSPLNTLAVMLFLMWVIDAVGLVPGAYPGYQIFVWGFIGLAIHGIEDLNNDSFIRLEIKQC